MEPHERQWELQKREVYSGKDKEEMEPHAGQVEIHTH